MIITTDSKHLERHRRLNDSFSASSTLIPNVPSKKHLASIGREKIPYTKEVWILPSSLNGLIQKGESDTPSPLFQLGFGKVISPAPVPDSRGLERGEDLMIADDLMDQVHRKLIVSGGDRRVSRENTLLSYRLRVTECDGGSSKEVLLLVQKFEGKKA